MALRSPAEFYLKYLIVHPDEYTDEQIKSICADAGLDSLGTTYLQDLRDRCVAPKPFYPNNALHIRSHRFLIKEGIRSLYHPDDNTRIALRVLRNPRAKEFVEAMILSHAPLLEIASAVVRYRGMHCTGPALEQYKKYFWNVDLLDSTQMRTLMHYRVEVSGATGENASKEDRALNAAAKKASYMDPRRLAADLPYSPVTALMSQMRMGAMPGKLELAQSVELVQAMAVLRAAEATLYGSLKDSITAKNFSDVARNMTEMLESIVKPDENLREQLHAIALRTDTAPIPSIHQLSSGAHTAELQPMSQETNELPGTAPPGGRRDRKGAAQEP